MSSNTLMAVLCVKPLEPAKVKERKPFAHKRLE
jgi:hypothetical protein